MDPLPSRAEYAQAISDGTARTVCGPDRSTYARMTAQLVVAMEEKAQASASGLLWPSETAAGELAVKARAHLFSAYGDWAQALLDELNR